jgi:hypothetical protein
LRAPESYIEWVNAHLGFNPRGQANSDALSDFVVADLQESCPTLRSALQRGELKPQKNPAVQTAVAERSIDLVLSETGDSPKIAVRVSVEHKTIMTAHGKARKNRYGDIIAYSNHMHNHNPKCIAGAIVIVSVSPLYENPDAFAKGLVRPKFKMEKIVIVKDTVSIFEKIPLRDTPDDPGELPETLAVIVVDYDGANPSKLVTGGLAPQLQKPVHYENFIRRICDLYGKRFTGR